MLWRLANFSNVRTFPVFSRRIILTTTLNNNIVAYNQITSINVALVLINLINFHRASSTWIEEKNYSERRRKANFYENRWEVRLFRSAVISTSAKTEDRSVAWPAKRSFRNVSRCSSKRKARNTSNRCAAVDSVSKETFSTARLINLLAIRNVMRR